MDPEHEDPGPPEPGAVRVPCRRGPREEARAGPDASDLVVVEEPLELRVRGEAFATLMRTPGHDRELALGLFLGEGVIAHGRDVAGLITCSRRDELENVVDLLPAAHARADASPPPRLVSTASCGVCGKRSIADVFALTPRVSGRDPLARSATEPTPPGAFRLRAELVPELPARLRAAQALFHSTGSLHGAALVDARGTLLVAREDIGRHNAVDKVVGWAVLEDHLPLTEAVLQVSGRVSFEIVQKAYRAGIPLVAAISGVSSLAIALAERAGITLVGFVRDGSFNVYTHPGKIVARGPA